MDNFSLMNNLDEQFKLNIEYYYVFSFGEIYALIITKDDRVFILGCNDDRALSLSNNDLINEPKILRDLCGKGIVSFASDYSHVLALTKKGEVYFLSRDFESQNDRRRDKFPIIPSLFSKLFGKFIIKICCGRWHSMALARTGEVYSWEYKDSHQLNFTHLNEFTKEIPISISCGTFHMIALNPKGEVTFYSPNVHCSITGEKLHNEFEVYYSPSKRTRNLNERFNKVCIKRVECAAFHILLLSKDGDIYLVESHHLNDMGNEIRAYEHMNLSCTKFECSNKFIEIAAHSSKGLSSALSELGNFHVWIENNQRITHSEETLFRSFEEVFCHYCGITFETIHCNDYKPKIDLCLKTGEYEKSFQEINIISSGQFGIVYKVVNKMDNNIYAIKKIPLNEIPEEKNCTESIVMSKFKSKYIVNCYKTWIEKNTFSGRLVQQFKRQGISSSHEVFDPYKKYLLHIQMELCGMTLKQFKQNLKEEFKIHEFQLLKPQAYYIACEILKEILTCVDFLHKRNLIHRDLKPENILIFKGLDDNFVKIGDFGLSTSHDSDEQSHTVDKGTHKYTAPEVHLTRKYDKKADIYSLGMISQELFNFDINRFNHSEIDHLLKNEYTKMFEKVCQMMSVKTSDRPDCDKLLNEKYSWTLSTRRFQNIVDLRSIDLCAINDNFLSLFIRSKLNQSYSRSNSLSEEI